MVGRPGSRVQKDKGKENKVDFSGRKLKMINNNKSVWVCRLRMTLEVDKEVDKRATI